MRHDAPEAGGAPRAIAAAFCGAAVGCGHGRAGLAVRDAMRVRGQLGQASFVDALELAPWWFTRAYRDGYLRAVRHAPRAVGAIYDRTDVPRHGRSGLRAAGDRLQDRVLDAFRRHPALHGSDVVVSTHFLTSAVLGRMREDGALRAPLVTVVTDEHPHAVWLHRGSDMTCVASPSAREAAIAGGLDPARVTVTGIPVDPRFGMAIPRFPGEGPVNVLVTGGGCGIGDVGPTVGALLDALRDATVTVVSGRNAALEAAMLAMQATGRGASRGNALRVIGYTKLMHEFMAAADVLVGKPGGLTTTEARALGLPMVLLRPIPGQEDRNARMLVAAGAASRADGPLDAAAHVAAILAEPARLAGMRRASAAIGRPRAAFDVAACVADAVSRPAARCADRIVGMGVAAA
jgi:processive 1,2-diacylglycerol beta-glucosyltransferase